MLEKDELLAAARRRKLDALLELRVQHENQIIALDQDRKRVLGTVGEAVDKVGHTMWARRSVRLSVVHTGVLHTPYFLK